MSKIINDANLPEALFRALSHDGYNPGKRHTDISVTSLIGPPLIFQLKKRHGHKIVENATSRVWSLLGTAMHYVADKAAGPNSLNEERLYKEILGWTVSGQLDLYEDGTLSDYKVTSVYSFLLGDKPEWSAQLNFGATLLRHAGFPVTAVNINAILRDWQASKAKYDMDYPQAPVIIKPMPLWPDAKASAYMEERVRLHQAAEKLADDDIPLCTPEERWRKEDSWAIIANSNKRATAVVHSEDEANSRMAFLANANPKKKFRIEFRPSEDTKCQSYCSVAKFCRYGQIVLAGQDK